MSVTHHRQNPIESIRKILTEEVDMRKMVPKELTKEKEFLASKQIMVLEHPPYLPDPAPMTFFCSRR
jgi:hypothetical protein